MTYFSEFVGSLIFLLGGYGYMCNVSLKKTLVSSLNYIELVFAWSLAVGFGLCVAVIMGGPAYLNPGVVFGEASARATLLYIFLWSLSRRGRLCFCVWFSSGILSRNRKTLRKEVFSRLIPYRKICL